MAEYYLIDETVPVKIEGGKVLVYRPHKNIFESGKTYLKYIYESPAYSDREVEHVNSKYEFEQIMSKLRADYLKSQQKD